MFKFVLATMMFPFFIGLIPSYMLISWLGLNNTLLGVILPAGASAYTIFFLRQYILTVPDELIEAARISGASEFKIYWRIIVPLIKPALISIGLLNSVWIWNDLIWPMVVLQSRDLATVQVALAGLWDIRGQLSDINLVLASAFIAAVPTIIIAIIAIGYLIKGFTGLGYVKR
ncbi:MAG: carbohydrate ABC transporter permease [Actinomycetota bacterium]|nr:carbohydrate ABC transporter permease [Actinomycetota bacterium]